MRTHSASAQCGALCVRTVRQLVPRISEYRFLSTVKVFSNNVTGDVFVELVLAADGGAVEDVRLQAVRKRTDDRRCCASLVVYVFVYRWCGLSIYLFSYLFICLCVCVVSFNQLLMYVVVC